VGARRRRRGVGAGRSRQAAARGAPGRAPRRRRRRSGAGRGRVPAAKPGGAAGGGGEGEREKVECWRAMRGLPAPVKKQSPAAADGAPLAARVDVVAVVGVHSARRPRAWGRSRGPLGLVFFSAQRDTPLRIAARGRPPFAHKTARRGLEPSCGVPRGTCRLRTRWGETNTFTTLAHPFLLLFSRPQDMTTLSHLNEPGVLYNLQTRCVCVWDG
jgi:hypothetical protein